MKTSEKHLQDLSQIRQIMERSTKFLSLSGWAGIVAGVMAIIGTVAAFLHLKGGNPTITETFIAIPREAVISPRMFLLLDAIFVLLFALTGAVFLSWRKAKKSGDKIWSTVTRRMLYHLAIPLVTGGILCIILLVQNHVNLIAPLTLIFYGLALVNAGKYTTREVQWLGIAEIITGIAATLWQEHGLWFWGTGFGIYHIIYGVTLYYKYDRKSVTHA
jgi:hypothetical protein